MNQAALSVEQVTVEIDTPWGLNRALDRVSFEVGAGETLGLVGESGSGKSMTCNAILRLLPRRATMTGTVRFHGKDLGELGERAMRGIRGSGISMILQDPLASLNPSMKIGRQVEEAIRLHQGLRGSELRRAALDMLRAVGIPAAADRFDAYPHELSGGMRQRVVGAIALSCRPAVLLADEPTTSLDATVQAQYLQLLKRLQADLGFALVFVTHDLGVVGRMCDRLAVMYAGRVVETGPTVETLLHPTHPYTAALLGAIPRFDGMSVVDPKPIPGQVPSPFEPVPGCPFAPRCAYRYEACSHEPPLTVLPTGQAAACWMQVSVAR